MTGPSFLCYSELDPAKKGAQYIDLSITTLRRDWRKLVDPQRALINKQLLLSEQSLEYIKKSFSDEDFLKCTEFPPLPIMENILNTLIEEITKQPPTCELFATDPSAISEKKRDINILKSRKLIEGVISQAQKATGGPPQYKLGQDNFKSNISDFDSMGLDENDPDDVNFFSQDYQRLLYEIGGQDLINNVIRLNRFDEDMIEPLVIDALAHKALCMAAYVDRMTGEIKFKYIYPEIAYIIPGNSNDGHDDICKGWMDMSTLSEFLEMAGNEFIFERDWRKLLWALSYSNSSFRFTGFTRNGMNYDCFGNQGYTDEAAGYGLGGWEQSNMCDWTQAYTYKVYVGYIEWPTAEATTTYLKKYGTKADYVKEVPYSYELTQMKEVKEYEKESLYQQQMYGSYFLATTSISQWIFNFSKVYYQQTEGVNDEYACGSLIYYRKRGRPAAELCEPYIRIANFAFYKMLWAIFHAKPDSDIFYADEMAEVTKWVDKQNTNENVNVAGNNFQGVLEELMQMERTKMIKFRATPRVDGKPVQMQSSNDKKHNGLDPIAISMQACITWAEQQIMAKIGMNDLRLGQVQQAREGYKLNMAETENSLTSTGYIYRMIQYTKERIATYTLNFAQDIVKFEDSIPYKWIQTLVGNESFAQIQLLKDFAAHRFGLFIRDKNMQLEKQKIIAAADVSLQQKEITLNQYYIVIATEDTKKAFKLLDFLKMKEARKLRKQQIQDQQQQQKLAAQQHQQQMELEQTVHQNAMELQSLKNKGAMEVAQTNSEGKINVKQLSVNADGPKAQDKAEAAKDLATHKNNLEAEKAFNSK
jgi:hypothetical protein